MATDSPFSAGALAAAVEAELATIPAGKSHALVGYWRTDGQWCVSLVGRAGDTWQYGLQLERDLAGGRVRGSVTVRAVW